MTPITDAEGSCRLKVLILDDASERLSAFRAKYGIRHDLTTVMTAEGAIERLHPQVAWDWVFLDHDLGGEVYADSQRPDTGMEVVRHILKARPPIRYVVVHSLNGPAAREMVLLLKESGYRAAHMPFAWAENANVGLR